MEARTAGFGIAGIVMATFAGIVIFSMEMDSQRSVLEKEKKALKETEESLEVRTASLEKAKERIKALASEGQVGARLAERLERLNKEKADVESEIVKLEKVAPAMKKELLAATAEVRSRAVGEELAEVVLTTGMILRDARIQKVEESEIAFGHSQGVTRVPWKILPAELIARFRFSDPPAVAAKTGAAGEPAENDESAVAATGQPVPEIPNLANSPPVRDLEGRISKLQLQIDQARRTQQTWNQKAQEYRTLHARAQYLGRSSSHLIKAEEAAKQSVAIEQQIHRAEEQIRRFNFEIQEKIDSPR
jgi:hypothetical protein